jgi:hypothetical protein
MRIWTWGLALSLAMTGVAVAQPAPPPPGPMAPATPPETTAAPAPVAVTMPEPVDTGRPSGLVFGIGFGYVFPTSLQTPNVTSVRVRLPTGLTFEPQVVFATTSDKVDTGMTATNKQSEITLGSLVRFPLRVHGRIDLEGIGAAAISNRTVDPEGDDNNRTITTVGVNYGLALAYWFTPHWNLSFTATNPLFAYTRTRQEMGAANTTIDSSTTIGLIFDPLIAMMLHLYD